MKKILVLTAVFLMTASLAFADMVIAPDALPANVKQFCHTTNVPDGSVENKYRNIRVNTR